jgi:DNA processing protein
VAALAGNLEIAWRSRKRLRDVLSMDDSGLIEALGGADRDPLARSYDEIDPDDLISSWEAAGVVAVCRHDARYPTRLATLPDAPAILFCAGDPSRLALVAGAVGDGPAAAAVVGTRRPLPEGDEFAQALGRGLAGAGVTVVSGMAMGIDSAAHTGALQAGGPTIAVLACGPEIAYPRSKRVLHERLVREQLVIAELPPGSTPWRWAFPARNRMIAALGNATIVVEAAERSGSLITVDFATELGRDVGVVPGRAGSPRTRGGNGLLREGAAAILEVGDALDLVLGAQRDRNAPVQSLANEEHAALLRALAEGADSIAALASHVGDPDRARIGLIELEMLGLVRRVAGDRYVAVMR